MRTIEELMDLTDRVALVTGGAGHIGSAICCTLAELGANVVILDVNKDDCELLSAHINRKYLSKSFPLAIDLSQEKEIGLVADIVSRQFGRLDILVNCAAFVGTSELKGWCVPFQYQSIDTWRKVFEVNLTSIFTLTQACADMLKKSRHGSVINISSIYGVVAPDMSIYEGTDMGNPAAYAVSKGGLLQLTRWLSTVMAPNVRVNAITPGGIWRNQDKNFQKKYITKTPLKRMATEEDIQGAVAYLASDLSSYVTGHNLIVDGGFTVW